MRHALQLSLHCFKYISIHAPAKGATKLTIGIGEIILFQSTHPRRVRLSTRCSNGVDENFNPRTREGCDEIDELFIERKLLISIHAPAKGATLKNVFNKIASFISIHAPAKGAT